MYIGKFSWSWFCCQCKDGSLNNFGDGSRKTLEESQQNNIKPQMCTLDFGQTCMGIAVATTSALIMDERARNYIAASCPWVSNIPQNPYTNAHTENLCRTIACVSAYTGCTTMLYRSGRCKHRDIWLICGIFGVVTVALSFGWAFEEILLKILPWTVLISLLCSAACYYCTSCPEFDTEYDWATEQN